MTPQDIAAALGFVRDPLARELFCLTRWPGYAERDNRETRVLLLSARDGRRPAPD